ncbi:zinc finger, CCHC-type containing protein [Tanacetum coccineum]|uniref:Zinc finger, CCHC-type containing protein n=1 Tax=Tanacetum coccineum TaxID=301880 RepID=A0ABQ4WXG8_9ASTR
MTNTVIKNSVFRAFFEKQRLTGPNFIDLYRNLQIVLSVEDKLPFLEQPIPAMSVPLVGQVLPPDVLATHTARVKASKEIAEQELLQTVREFHAYKQEEGQSVSSYVLKMKSHIDNLERLGHAMTQNLAVRLILVSLRKEYDNFVQNYNMHGMGKTVTELHVMLKLHEQTLPKKEVAHALHAIRAKKVQKKHKNKIPQLAGRGHNQGKGKSKLAYAPKPKIPPPPKKDNLAKDLICNQCGDGLRGSRKLKPGALSLYMGDGHRATVEAIGTYLLFQGMVSMKLIGPHISRFLGIDLSVIVSAIQGMAFMVCLTMLKHNPMKCLRTLDKCFQKEVEDQLGKTIKLLRSVRGGEYMSSSVFGSSYGVLGIIAFRRSSLILPQHKCMHSQHWFKLEGEKTTHMRNRAQIGQAPSCLTIEAGDCSSKQVSRLKDLEIIQEEDTPPFENTSLHHDEDDQEVYEPQSDVNPIRSKWLFKKKTDMDGTVHTYKARLVAKGFTQTYGVDYEETFSPIADIRAIKILIAIAAEAAYILGIKIYRDRSKRLIGLCQSAYIDKILKRFYMENSKRGSIPMQEKLKLSKSRDASTPAEVKCMQNIPYAIVMGSIMYDLMVSCYTDAGYLTDADDLKSHTGYVFVLNRGALDWKSTKQSILATSSAEAEYIAAYDASKEAVWIRKFIYGLGIVAIIKEPIRMYCDNTKAITIANESGITKGSRHYCTKLHYLREVIELGDLYDG